MTGAVAAGLAAPAARPAGADLVFVPSTPASPAQLDQAVAVMRSRIAVLGVRGTVVREGTRIVLRLASTAGDLVGTIIAPGRFGIYELTPSLLPPSIDAAHRPVATTNEAKLHAAGATVVSCASAFAAACPGVDVPRRGFTYYYLFKRGRAPIGSGDVVRSSVREVPDPNTGTPVVTFRLTRRGARVFGALTRAAAHRGRKLGVNESVAIVVDGRLCSFPFVDYRMYPAGLDASSGIEIPGLPTAIEAKRVATVLRTGPLPVALRDASPRAHR